MKANCYLTILVRTLLLTALMLPAAVFGNPGGEPVKHKTPEPKLTVKIYPNPSFGVANVNVKGPRKGNYEFFLFTAEGRLVQQIKLKDNQTVVLTNLAPGYYTYDVMRSDERLKRGRLIVSK